MLCMPSVLHRSAEVYQPRRPCGKVQEKVQYGIRTQAGISIPAFFHMTIRYVCDEAGWWKDDDVDWINDPMTEPQSQDRIKYRTKQKNRLQAYFSKVSGDSAVCFCEFYDIIRCAIQYFAQFFQCEQCDIIIFLQSVQRLVIDAGFQQTVLRHVLLFHRLPQRAVIDDNATAFPHFWIILLTKCLI